MGDCLKKNIAGIRSKNILEVIENIKKIQKRMLDPDLVDAPYVETYGTLSQEFSDFFNTHTNIFSKVVRGDDLMTVAQALFYKDKVNMGQMKESDLSQILADKYLPKK